MAYPIIKYRLRADGRQPEYLSKDSRAFKGQHSYSSNTAGKIPAFESPQENVYLGIAIGEPDSTTPNSYVGILTTKALLQSYITEVGSAKKYQTVTNTVVGVKTDTTVGLLTAWNNNDTDYLTTTTSSNHATSGVGTVTTLTRNYITGITTSVDTTTGKTTTTGSYDIVTGAATTTHVRTGSSDVVGIVTTGEGSTLTTTTTTTTTTTATYDDTMTNYSDSITDTTTDGVTTRTRTRTYITASNFETSYDYAAEATRLWDIRTAVNS